MRDILRECIRSETAFAAIQQDADH
jgi:hypothetical protein